MEIIQRFATKCPCWATNITQQGLTPSKRDIRYNEYYQKFNAEGPDLMLHSLGCARASADVQAAKWDVATNDNAIAHAVIDSNDGIARQTLRWDMRGWHCSSGPNGSGNNTHIGVEMCESDQIVYRTDKPWLFTIKDRAKAEAHCRTAYEGAVKLFADLCDLFHLDPMTRIISHKEGHQRGIASGHVDPEHYWTGLGMPYTMDTFRADVKRRMEDKDMIKEERVNELIEAALAPVSESITELRASLDSVMETVSGIKETDSALADSLSSLKTELGKNKKLAHVNDIPWVAVRAAIRDLVNEGYINGGTPDCVDPDDINMGLEDLRVMAVLKRYVDDKIGGVQNE